MKNTFGGLIFKTKERIPELGICQWNSQKLKSKEKKKSRTEYHGLWGHYKRCNLSITGISKQENRKGVEAVSETVLTGLSPS